MDSGVDRYVSEETAELSNAAYRFISEAVSNRKLSKSKRKSSRRR